jgi:hypothetical protein
MKTMKQDAIGSFMKALTDAHAQQLAQLGPRAFTKKTLEDMKAGFGDGLRSMLLALEDAGYLDVDRGEAPGAATVVSGG